MTRVAGQVHAIYRASGAPGSPEVEYEIGLAKGTCLCRVDGGRYLVCGPNVDSTFRRGVVASISGIDDTFLVRDAQRGNAAAFEQLVRLHDRAILKLALRLTGSESDAQDVYQEAFLKAYKNLSSFRFECCFSTWIYRIVTNVFLSHLRKKEVRKERVMVAVNAEGEECDLLDQFFR
jgi:hypothetical protein